MSDHENDKLRATADFDGPTKHRHCTDVLCLLLLVVQWIVLTGIGIYALMNGDIRLILNPLDFDGNICGTDFAADMTEYPNLLYVNNFGGGVCVKKCPDLDGVVADNLTDVRTLVTYGGIWQIEGAELEPNFIEIADYSNSSDTRMCTEETCFPNNSTVESWTSEGISEGYGYAYYAASTYELLNRCILTTNAESALKSIVGENSTSMTESSTVDDIYNFWNKLFGDIYIARKYILGFGFGVSAAVSLIYMFLLRIPFLLTGIIWTSIFGTIALIFAGGYYAWNQASIWADAEPKTVSDQTINATTGCSVALFVIGGIVVILACCLRGSIMLAIKCTKEAGRAVNSMVLILLVPVIQTLGFLLFMVAFVYYGANLASLGEITTYEVPVGVDGIDPSIVTEGDAPETTEIAYRQFVFDDFTKNCGWYMLFSLFWTSNFIVAMGDIIIAMSVAKWYFTKDKITIGSWTVLGSIIDTTWYHTGTAAFGSLLIAIVQLIRAIIAKLQREAKKVDSKIAQCLLCCCQCCFWCLEKLLKFISKNAYIQTAIFSTSFCSSCRASFSLIFRNAARIAAVTYVSAAVLIVGKLFISSIVTVSAYYYIIESGLVDELYSVGGPVSIVFLISYWLSDFFMDVLDMGISTVLHCFIADEEMFEPDQRYCDRSLKDYVDNHGGE